MTTSQNRSVLSELSDDKPISPKTLRYFRRSLQNRFHQLILQVFVVKEEQEGLTQKKLATRIGRAPEQINRWLHTASNLELDTLSDLLLGMLVDLNDLSVTPLSELIDRPENHQITYQGESDSGSSNRPLVPSGQSQPPGQGQSREMGTPLPIAPIGGLGASL